MTEEQFKKLKVGDKVRIKKIDDPTVPWNLEGLMDHYDGQEIIVETKEYDGIYVSYWKFSYDCLELVEQTKSSLKNTLITEIRDPEQHKRVQKKLFSEGYEWNISGKEIIDYGKRDIHIDDEKRMFPVNSPVPNIISTITANEYLREEKTMDTEYSVRGVSEAIVEAIKGKRVYLDDDVLLPPGVICNESYNNLNNKQTIMSKIIKFAKDKSLSADEKLLRKTGLKYDNGSWSSDAKALVLNFEAQAKGYKDLEDLQSVVDSDNPVSPFELATLLAEYKDQILATAKEYQKEEAKK